MSRDATILAEEGLRVLIHSIMQQDPARRERVIHSIMQQDPARRERVIRGRVP